MAGIPSPKEMERMSEEEKRKKTVKVRLDQLEEFGKRCGTEACEVFVEKQKAVIAAGGDVSMSEVKKMIGELNKAVEVATQTADAARKEAWDTKKAQEKIATAVFAIDDRTKARDEVEKKAAEERAKVEAEETKKPKIGDECPSCHYKAERGEIKRGLYKCECGASLNDVDRDLGKYTNCPYCGREVKWPK